MNTLKEQRAINQALDVYREWLDAIPDETFSVTPPMGGWSYSEVYDHIMKSSLGSSIALERCTHNNCPPAKKGLNFWGYYMMFTGMFPPGKAEMPEAVATKVGPKKIDKEEARNMIVKVRKRIETTAVLLLASTHQARWQHPRLGNLNATQWFKFIRVHLQHHLKQLDRIKNNFARQ